MQLFGRRYDTGEPVCLDIEGGKVSRVTQATAAPDANDWPWIAPGLIDIQFNGYGGQEFSAPDLTAEKVADIVHTTEQFGVTRFCPTLTTESFEVLQQALRTIAAACQSSADIQRQVSGIHLEGPYISPQDGARGAHPLQHVRSPDWDEFQRLQEAADGRIQIHTLSAEYDESPAFIERVVGSGVIVAIGHTAATPDQISRAVDAGARLSTHLGNGSHATLHRLRNYIWQQLADDRLTASLIVDGHHLPAAVVKAFVRAKTPDRCILVSDISGYAGQPPGKYAGNICDMEILPDGRLVVAGQRELLAGATLPIGVGIPNVMDFAGVDLATAVRMAVHNPAALLGHEMKTSGLEPGDPADLVQFEMRSGSPAAFDVHATIAAGRPISGTPWQPSPA